MSDHAAAEVDEHDCLPYYSILHTIAAMSVDVDYPDTHGMVEVHCESPLYHMLPACGDGVATAYIDASDTSFSCRLEIMRAHSHLCYKGEPHVENTCAIDSVTSPDPRLLTERARDTVSW